ncbi:MAG: hypothetical protein GY794_10155 [bacterium]|nr:hypothetical protein [bacterium]
MRINPTNNQNPEMQGIIPNAGGAAKPAESSGTQSPAQAGRPESSDAVHDTYIRRAIAADDIDLQAVAAAKKLIEDGLLDTPEGIAAAAENIVVRGI